MLLSDMILGRNNRWSTLYDPSRELKEEITKHYSSGHGDDKNNNDNSKDSSPNKNGENDNGQNKISHSIGSLGLEQAIITEGKEREGSEEGKKNDPVAIYKDVKGTIHTYSAICTHLGCTITWNSLEKSFDCPCHGSRFSSTGKVINGPANNNLEQKN
jgi:Rieske Fe-S protein